MLPFVYFSRHSLPLTPSSPSSQFVQVNAVTPGHTVTKLNGFAPGGKTPEQGATLLMEWALLDKNGKTGLFIGDKGEFP
ncbi:hypothetical protein B0H19DRAFT_1148269, partial [Mycena capillaripes]